jgi:hypothetical protein
MFIFSTIVVIAHFIITVSGYYENYYLMLTGRAILAIGGENLGSV